MGDKQVDLFADDHEMIGSIIDNLEHIPDDEIKQKWPLTLVDLLEVMACELCRQGFQKPEAKVMATKLAAIIAHYLGGRSAYIPNGKWLKDALRDYLIYSKFDGANVQQLCEEFRLSESHIYAIIRMQRTLLHRRHQPELPM